MRFKKFIFWWAIFWLSWCLLWACHGFIDGTWYFGMVQTFFAFFFFWLAIKNSDY